MPIKITHPLSFNQAFRFEDMKTGGNCFAYTVLYFTYLSVMQKRIHHEKNDVDHLHYVLQHFDAKKKVALNQRQDAKSEYTLLQDEIACLNDNLAYLHFDDLLFFCNLLKSEMEQFSQPIFYFFTVQDLEQKILGYPLSHSLGFYLANKNEIHFFNSVGGLFILSVPDNTEAQALKTTFISLLFKESFFFRFYSENSPSLSYGLNSCHLVTEWTEEQKAVKKFLKHKFNPSQKAPSIKTFSEDTQAFIDLQLAVLDLIKKSEQQYSLFDAVKNAFSSLSLFSQKPTVSTIAKSETAPRSDLN